MRKRFLLLISISLLAMIIALVGCGNSSKSEVPKKSKKVILTDAGWDSIKFHNAVVSFIAKNGYDLEPEIMAASSAICHTAIVRGDADADIENWSENIAAYEPDLKAKKFVELGINFDDNRQGFYVPRYVIEGDAKRGIKAIAPDLKTVEDLKKYSHVFVDEEDPSKGRIYGSIPGWSIDETLFAKYKYYGLDKNYNYFRPGSAATLAASFMKAYQAGEPIVGYNWEPTWISGKLDLVLLEDAPYTKEGYLKGETEIPSVHVTVTASNKFVKSNPDFSKFLANYHTSSALTAKALAYIMDNKASYDDAALHFIKTNEDLVKGWMPADKFAKVKAALSTSKS
jgi:ABC-type proline/glycine betaine transport system substrate-binding protein